jgi:hypothetical protein
MTRRYLQTMEKAAPQVAVSADNLEK